MNGKTGPRLARLWTRILTTHLPQLKTKPKRRKKVILVLRGEDAAVVGEV